MTDGASNHARGRLLARMMIGALIGGTAAVAFLMLSGRFLPDRGDPEAVVALMAAIGYGVMGLLVGLGTLFPKAGASFLHVEDAEEIREHRSLAPGAAASILVGLFLLILAVAPALAASFGRKAPVIAAFACLAAAGLIFFATRNRADELNRQIGLEASSLTLNIALVVLGGWAALAGGGYAGRVGPVGLIAALALLELAVIFYVSARKGLMHPRISRPRRAGRS